MKLSTALLVVALSCFVKAEEDTSKDGLECIKLSDTNSTLVCTGTNKNYLEAREKARKDKETQALDIQTRFFQPPCRGLSGCTAFQSSYAPTLLQNKAGQDRYIYQDEDFGFSQNIRVVTCTADPCGWKSSCQQTFRDYWLISWDPHSRFSVPIVDTFSVPDCCRCARD